MALHVDWSRLNPPITDGERENAAYTVGICMLMAGVPELKTDTDVREMVARMTFYSLLYGPVIQNANGEDMNGIPFWTRWLGVRVNGTKETRNAWTKRIASSKMSDILYSLTVKR